MHIVLFALTNIHPGAPGGGIEVADLPVYKDRFSVVRIRGEALKGALKSTFSRSFPELEEAIFGTTGQAGVFSFLDALLVFVPVTNAENGLVYLTSPLLLNHFAKHLAIGGVKQAQQVDKIVSRLEQLPLNEAASTINQGNEVTLLGEFTFKNHYTEGLTPLKDAIIELQREVFSNNPPMLIEHLVVLQDEATSVLMEKALCLKPGINIAGFKSDRPEELKGIYLKNVQHGPWYEEEVPKFSILSNVVTFPHRKVEVTIRKKEAKKFLRDTLTSLEAAKLTLKENEFEVEVGLQAIEKILEKHFAKKPLLVGGRETLTRGLVKAAKIKFKGKWPETQLRVEEKNEQVKGKSDPFIELLNEIRIKEKNASDLVGKFSSLPERMRKMPLISLYLFYTKIKAESIGAGYDEVRKILMKLKNEGYFSDEWLKEENELATLHTAHVDKLIKNYKKQLNAITKLKYVTRSYAKRGDGE